MQRLYVVNGVLEPVVFMNKLSFQLLSMQVPIIMSSRWSFAAVCRPRPHCRQKGAERRMNHLSSRFPSHRQHKAHHCVPLREWLSVVARLRPPCCFTTDHFEDQHFYRRQLAMSASYFIAFAYDLSYSYDCQSSETFEGFVPSSAPLNFSIWWRSGRLTSKVC